MTDWDDNPSLCVYCGSTEPEKHDRVACKEAYYRKRFPTAYSMSIEEVRARLKELRGDK